MGATTFWSGNLAAHGRSDIKWYTNSIILQLFIKIAHIAAIRNYVNHNLLTWEQAESFVCSSYILVERDNFLIGQAVPSTECYRCPNFQP